MTPAICLLQLDVISVIPLLNSERTNHTNLCRPSRTHTSDSFLLLSRAYFVVGVHMNATVRPSLPTTLAYIIV